MLQRERKTIKPQTDVLTPDPKIPQSSYDYNVFSCPTPEALQKKLTEWRQKAGFYWYMIPQDRGCLLVVATANPKAIEARHKPQTVKGLKLLTENEARTLLENCDYCATATQQDQLDRFIIWLYERDFLIVKRIPIKKEVET